MEMENSLPKGWVECSIGEILTAKKGKKPASTIDEPREGYVPYILIDEMEGKQIRTYTNDPKVSIIDETEVLLVWDGSIGKCGSGLKGAIGSTLVGLKALGGIQTKFLEYTIRQQNNFIKETSTGTGLQHINKDFFEICIIPLPPLPEQHRIVAKLDAFFEKIDSNKQRLEKIPKILKRFRQSVLAAAVSGKLTEEWRKVNSFENKFEIAKQFEINETYKEQYELPDNWKWVALGNYVKCNRGRFSIRPRNDPRYFGGDIPFIQIGDLPREGGFVNAHTQTLNELGIKVSKMFPKNTLAIAIVGATIANTGILAYDMCFTDSMVGMNKGDLDLNLFIDYYLRIEKENFRQLSYAGGGQPNIKLELLNAYPFPLPPKEEQKEIVRRVEQLLAFADKIEARYTKAKAMLDKLPQSILTKAFLGGLVAQDPNDEPASVLLERIKAEKEKLAADKKRKKTKEYSIEEKPVKIAAEKMVKYKKK
jgi:type I restriction enzyme S subunit